MNFEEKTLKSEVVYDGKIMTVLRDDVEICTGRKSFREVVRHSGGVVVFALKDDETVLMVRQYRYPLGKVIAELPAGKLEQGEDPDFAAKRELEEETGYRAEKWTSLGFINTTPGFCDEKLYLYKAEELTYVGEHPDEGEVLKNFEISKNELVKKIMTGEINDAKTVCAVFRGLNL